MTIIDLSSLFIQSSLQADKSSTGSNSPYTCLSDFIAPAGSGVDDYVGVFAVSVGFGCKELCDKYVSFTIYLKLLLSFFT